MALLWDLLRIGFPVKDPYQSPASTVLPATICLINLYLIFNDCIVVININGKDFL